MSMLAQERQLLDATIQAMGQGLMLIGPDQRVRLFNDQACQMLALPREFLATRPLLSEVVAFQNQRGDFGSGFLAGAKRCRPRLCELTGHPG
jgi:PAS domain-containing protein